MSEEREPVRLRDDPSEDAGLREVLEAARGEHADAAMLDRVLAGVLAGGGGGGGGGGGHPDPTGAAAWGKAAAATASIVIGAAAVVAIGGRFYATPHERPRPLVVTDTGAVLTDAGMEPEDAGPPDAGATDAGPGDAGPPPATTARVRSPLPPTTIAEAETDGALMMRIAREHDPSRRLALAIDHRARFPDSPSAEDREAVVVRALAALHRSTEARAALESFRARFPRSPALPNLEAAVAR